MPILGFPMPLSQSSEHKKPDFVLEMPKNGGSEGQKRTKTSILCSKSLKSGVPKGKSAQKPRFCARNARKRGFRRAKAHKNADFVLERPENGGSESKKRTKMAILCSKCPKTRVLKAWAPTVYAEELPTLLEMAAAWPGADAQTQNKNRRG